MTSLIDNLRDVVGKLESQAAYHRRHIVRKHYPAPPEF